MNKNLGLLIANGLDLTLFWSMTISNYEVSLMGTYSKKTENYLIAKGFERYFYCYQEDNKELTEYKHADGIRIVLTTKTK